MKVPEPRQLDSGNWFIQLRLGGESIPVTTPTKSSCRQEALLIKAEYKAGKRVKSESINLTLREVVDMYIDSRSNILSPSTIRGYTDIQRTRFIEFMDKRISNISDWQEVCNKEAAKCSPKTLKNSWALLKSALKYAKYAVPDDITLPLVPRNKIPFLEPQDLNKFVAAAKGHAGEIEALLALHGLRTSEILGLTWEKNIDLQKKMIIVSGAKVFDRYGKTVDKPTNKNVDSQRHVPILIESLCIALEKVKNKSGTVVSKRRDTIYGNIVSICKRAGLPPVGTHGLRHSFASLCYHLKMPELVCMQLGGWNDYKTMREIYTHLGERDMGNRVSELKSFFDDMYANENANESANKI